MPITNSIYAGAPDMLLDKIAEVDALLAKLEAKSGQTDSFKFWKSVSDTMKFSWSYMIDTAWIHREASLKLDENIFLKDRLRSVQSQLSIFETIRKLRTDNNLDEVIANVDAYLSNPEVVNLLTLKKEIKSGK